MDQDRITRIFQIKEIFQGILYQDVAIFYFYGKPCQRSRILFRVYENAHRLIIIQQHSHDGVADLSGGTGY